MKILKNKRGIELSINFIVMLILAIAVFAGGLMFAAKFFGQAEKIRGNMDAQTEKQIEKLLDSGSPVVIPINTKEIFRNKYDTFGVGVLAQDSGKFTITVKDKSAYNADKSAITDDFSTWYEAQPSELELKKNEKGKFLVIVKVPKSAKKGTYIFEASVDFKHATDSTQDMSPYDNPIQFIVKVP
ncbi:hypothetical protein KY363_06015 [Candidatus Woesearchaeota archaeon]|nr:hypothetical protein [Candidatus Woesearchaeota archaeon]